MAVWGSWGDLTNSWEKKRSERQRKKGKIYPFECRVPKYATRDKKAFLSDQCKEIEENNRTGRTRDLFWRRQWHPLSSTLAWKIPWTEEPGRLQSMGSLRVRHDWVTSLWLVTFMHWRRKWQPTPVFLPGESQGDGGPPKGSHRVRHDWSDSSSSSSSRHLFKKIRDTKGTFHSKMCSIKDRNGMDLTEAEDIKKRWQ